MKTMFAAIAALSFATSAYAATNENPFAKDTTTLQLKGLDLSTADGQQRLAIRMDQAARAVCGDRVSSIHLDLDAQARDCRTQVIADIRGRIEARQAAVSTRSKVQMASN